MTRSRLFLASALGLACATLAAPAYADMMMFHADLSGPGENPPTTSAGTGMVDAQYDSATKKLSWKGSYSGLTGPETAAHFHGPAPMGVNAGVMVPVDAAASPFQGSATLNADQAKALMDGMLYFNVHTAQNKNGEIRGQVMAAK